jgi:hypothetical protein
VTELEHDLWIARSETVNVRDPPAQNERIAVERKVRRIHENDFPDFRTQAGLPVLDKADTGLLCYSPHDLSEVTEAFHGFETVRFQDKLSSPILHSVQRSTVRVARRRFRRL